MPLPLGTRIKHSMLVLTGRVSLPHDPTYMRLLQDMSDYDTALARLKDSAARTVAKAQTDSTTAATATQTAAAVEAQTVADMNAVANTLDAYAGPASTGTTTDNASDGTAV